ncbi:DUF2997 domain-containing protein [Clostridium peptidivorans]|uniref:DUF2997 domain-containing protein n=1 Tax=Clostridium peptidivorans TaxID=100174 RepID=UPI000BE329EE|nr:DUF2997 domain-containing protein [Clostridium peptidivorans]
MKKLIIKINKGGSINAETQGIKGSKCMDYIKVVENLLEAETVDSEYTKEFFESDSEYTNIKLSNNLNLREEV